jgi:hypothetical protein
MKASKLVVIAMALMSLAGYASNSAASKPLCYAHAEINRQLVSVPILAKQDVANREYLAGAPFYYWTSADQFADMGNCKF